EALEAVVNDHAVDGGRRRYGRDLDGNGAFDLFGVRERLVRYDRPIAALVDVPSRAQLLDQDAGVLATVQVVVGLNERLGGIRKGERRTQVGVRGQAKAVDHVAPDEGIDVHQRRRPEQALLVPGAYTSFGGIVEVVGVSPGVIDVTSHPATVVAVPVEQAPPVVRWN